MFHSVSGVSREKMERLPADTPTTGTQLGWVSAKIADTNLSVLFTFLRVANKAKSALLVQKQTF